MKFKKYLKLCVMTLVLAFSLSVMSLEARVINGSGIITVYAAKKTAKKAKVKKDKRVLKQFEEIVEGNKGFSGDKIPCYTDVKNNKMYIPVEDFFCALQGTTKEAHIKVNIKKKSVKVSTDKKYKNIYRYVGLPKKIYGKPENIIVDIDGNKTLVKGYVVKSNFYWSNEKALYADFDELAEMFDLIFDKDLTKKKYLLYTKLPDNAVELKSDKPLIESYVDYADTEISQYDIDERWANPIGNYLYEENGNLVRIEAKRSYDKKENSRIDIKRYDVSGNLLETKELAWQGEKFGGFYRGEENNYLFFGNSNKQKNDSKEIIRIVKLDRDFNELGNISVNGAYTVYPFDAGSLRCAEVGQTVLVHTSRERYDGHQSQLTIAFNEDTMSLLNADDLGEFQRNHISHDFNQFAISDGNEFVTVDHGDAYPRSIKVSWLRAESLKEEYIPEGENYRYKITDRYMLSSTKEKEILNIPGETGANQTGVSIGGVIGTTNKILVGVNRIDYSKAVSFGSFYIKGKDVYKRDVVLYSVDKASLDVIENKYTDYKKEKNITYTAPKPVKIDDTRIMLIWNKLNKKSGKSELQYLMTDENGNGLSEIKTVEGMKIADESPTVYNNKVVWSEYRNGRLVLNSIPLD